RDRALGRPAPLGARPGRVGHDRRSPDPDPAPARHRRHRRRLRPARALLRPHLPGQGADRLRVQPVRGPGGRHRRPADGAAGVRAGRAARRARRGADHAAAAHLVRHGRDADRERLRRRRLRRAHPAGGRPRRGAAAGGGRDHGRRVRVRRTPAGGGARAHARGHDRPGQPPLGDPRGGGLNRITARFVAGAAALAVALALPLVLDDSALAVYVLLGLAAIVTVGVSLLMGFAGQVSLGQGAFYGVGAYTAALLALNGFPPLVGLVAAPLVAAVFAAVIGMPLLRLRGHHLAFATLAVQLILLSLAGQLEFTGGDIGLQGIPQFGIGSWEMDGAASYAWLTWAALALVMLITHHVITSRPGRALRALATSETA